eukprot:scaffold42800_cov52-Attheya_sp.AAC.4
MGYSGGDRGDGGDGGGGGGDFLARILVYKGEEGRLNFTAPDRMTSVIRARAFPTSRRLLTTYFSTITSYHQILSYLRTPMTPIRAPGVGVGGSNEKL